MTYAKPGTEEGDAFEGQLERGADPDNAPLARLAQIRKAIIQLGPAAIAVLMLLDVDASREITVLTGIALSLIPIATWYVRNEGQVDVPFANKAVATLGTAVVGVCMLFGVDVGREVEQVVAAAMTVTPLLVGWISNGPSLSGLATDVDVTLSGPDGEAEVSVKGT